MIWHHNQKCIYLQVGMVLWRRTATNISWVCPCVPLFRQGKLRLTTNPTINKKQNNDIVWLLVGLGIPVGPKHLNHFTKIPSSKVLGTALPPRTITSNDNTCSKRFKDVMSSIWTRLYSQHKKTFQMMVPQHLVGLSLPHCDRTAPQKEMGPLLSRSHQIFALWSWICFLNTPVMGQMIPNC